MIQQVVNAVLVVVVAAVVETRLLGCGLPDVLIAPLGVAAVVVHGHPPLGITLAFVPYFFTMIFSSSAEVGGLVVGAAEVTGADDDEVVSCGCPVAACGEPGAEPGTTF